MADDSSTHLIRLIVQGVNKLGDVVDKAVSGQDKLTGAQDKNTKSIKANEKAIADLRAEHARVISEIKNGNKTYDDARFNLARLSAEFDKLARKQKLGSSLAEDLNRSGLAAKQLSEHLKTAHETEKRLEDQAAKDRVRREEERQRLTQQTIAQEIKEEEKGVKARQSLMSELMDAVRQDHEDRLAFNRELSRHEIEEDKRRTKSRIDEAHKAAQQVADISRQQDVRAATPTIRQRIAGFFGREDTGPRRFVQDLVSVKRASSEAERGVSRLDRVLEKLHGTTNKAGFSIAKVDNNLRGLAVVGVIAFAQQFISILVGLAGTLLSVGAAAVQAGAALAGAFVAGIGQAVPVIGVLIAAFGRIGAVFKAVQLFNKDAARSGRDQAAAADAQAAAADRVASAQESVASASQRVRQATEDLTKARQLAVQNIQDLNLAERSASSGQFQSEVAIRRAISAGDVGSLEGLRIQRDQASLTAGRSARDASQARGQGVEGSDQVRQAVQTLEEANTALGRANREMAAARRAAAQAAQGTTAADNALKDALGQLSKAELGLYESVKRIQATFKRLFRPITDIIVTAFSGAIDRVRAVMADPRILGPLRQIAEAVATSIGRITKELTSDRSINFFKLMATEAAKNIPLLTSIGIKVNRIFSVIARAASPALRKFLEFFDDLATKGDRATDSKSGLSRLQRFFLRGEEMAESFTKLAGSVIGLFAALAGAGAADTGQSAVDQLVEQINKATDWVNENQGKVRQFFKDTLDASKSIASAVFEVGKFLTETFSNDKVKDFTEIFKNVLLPALLTSVLALGGLTDLFVKFLDLPVVSDVAQFALSIGLISKAFRVIGRLLLPLSRGIVLLLADLPLLGGAFAALGEGIAVLSAFLTGPWGLAIAAVIVAIVLLDRKFHFLAPTVRFIGKVFKETFDDLKTIVLKFADAWLGLVTTMLGGISSLASAASHLPFVGDQFKGVADFIDGARGKIDGWRESIRGMADDHDKAGSSLEKLRGNVFRLQARLVGLDKGSEEYRATARKLHVAQDNLNVAMADAEKKGKRGARGPRAIGQSAADAADAVDAANRSIVKGYNSLAQQLGGIKKITYTAGGVTVKGKSGSVTSDSGDILAGTSARAMGGWMGGQQGGLQGPDDIHVMAGRGEAFLNVPQQGPVEEGLSLRSMFFGGPGSLSDLFRQSGGAMFAAGGFVDKVRQRAAHLAAMHLPYRWGGGHGVGTIDDKEASGGLDCSGAVGYALGIPARFSGDYRSLGREGDRGQVVVYSNAEHTFMKILGRFFGTSGFGHPRAGTGASWFTVPPSSDYLRRFTARSIGANDIGDGAGMTGFGDIASPRIKGPAGALRDLAQRAASRAARAANRHLATAFGTSGQGLRDPGQAANTGQIRRWISAGLRLASQRVTPAAISTLLGRIIQESSGNPRAVNPAGPGGAADGPKGILQTIGSTFRRYMVRGHGNVFNPVDNIAAAVRYMLSRYGHLVGRGPGGYATGGFVGGASKARSSTVYKPPTVFNSSVRGIIAELRNAQAAIQSIATRGPRFVRDFARSISAITDDGGLLDQGTTAIQRVVDQMALKLRQATFSVRRSGLVVRRLTPEQVNVASISALDQQRESLQSLRAVGTTSLRDVERRLAAVQKGGVSSKERAAYETLVAARRSLIAKIGALDVAIADAIEARFNAQEQVLNDAISAVNARASRTATRADLFDRVANLVEAAGASQAAFAVRGNDLQIRAANLIAQRDALGQLANVASAQGNQPILQDLIGQIEELNVSLLENAAAIRSNTVQARQAAIDQITNRGSFLGSVSTGLQGIIQTLGTITGTLDVPRLRELLQQSGGTLGETGAGLRQKLFEGFNVDLRGLQGTDLVDALRNLDFGPIQSASVELRTQFEGLIGAIIDNAGSVAQNTQQLQELSQTVEQSFSSTAWQLFRQAIFDGSGGLLPRYQFAVPAMATGGSILTSGLFYGHRDEMVVPARVARDTPWTGSGDTTNINITPVTGDVDPGYIADVLSFRKSLSRAT